MTGKPVREPHDSTGEPGAGNRPAGFGERGEETYPRDSACGPVAKAPDKPPTPTGYAPILDSYLTSRGRIHPMNPVLFAETDSLSPRTFASKSARIGASRANARRRAPRRRRHRRPARRTAGRGRSGGPTPSTSSASCRPSTRPGASSCPSPWPTPGPPSSSRASAMSTSTPSTSSCRGASDGGGGRSAHRARAAFWASDATETAPYARNPRLLIKGPGALPLHRRPAGPFAGRGAYTCWKSTR